MVELLVATTLGMLVMLIMTQLFSGMKLTYRAQEGLTRVQEDGRVAVHLMSEVVRKTGFRAPVWNEPLTGYSPLTAGSVDGGTGGDDTLQLMYQDGADCLGTVNASIDAETGEPRADYKRVTFAVVNDVLQWTCEYGASPLALNAQINSQNIIDGVESFQILYGVDTDFPPDFSANSWTTADNITPESTVCLQSDYLCEAGSLLDTMQDGVPVAVRIGLLVSSPDPAGADDINESFNVLDVNVAATDDQRMRKLFTSTITIRNLTL